MGKAGSYSEHPSSGSELSGSDGEQEDAASQAEAPGEVPAGGGEQIGPVEQQAAAGDNGVCCCLHNCLVNYCTYGMAGESECGSYLFANFLLSLFPSLYAGSLVCDACSETNPLMAPAAFAVTAASMALFPGALRVSGVGLFALAKGACYVGRAAKDKLCPPPAEGMAAQGNANNYQALNEEQPGLQHPGPGAQVMG